MIVGRDRALRDAEDGGGIRIDTEDSLTSPDGLRWWLPPPPTVNKLARGGSAELPRMLWRRSEALSVAAWAGGMIYPSPLSRRARCLLFLSHRGFVPTALPRAPRSLLQTACSIACEVRFDFVARLSTAAIPDPLADCSVGIATWADHMQLQPRPATPVELRGHRIDGSSGSAQ